MPEKFLLTPEMRFCVRYLVNRGINAFNFNEAKLALKKSDPDFDLVKVERSADFFDELATKLRELWPPGEKDGKWPWRDSAFNLSRRLKTLWKERQLRDYSLDDCLAVARRYLAQYEQDTRYMMVLKYFILKQKTIVEKDGHERYMNESRFADMLESTSDFEKMDDEWKAILNESTDDDKLV